MDDPSYFFNRVPGKTIVGSRFQRGGDPARIASQVVEVEGGPVFYMVNDEVVVRTTSSRRQQIKAVFLEDSRAIKSLTLQRFTSDIFPTDQHFTFTGEEITKLIEFLACIPSLPLDDSGKRHVSASELRNLLLSKADAQQLFRDHEDMFIQVAEGADLKRDLIALGYRRKQLDRFERLLSDPEYFRGEQSILGPSKRPEDVWQTFFEANTWVFGYGLSFQFSTALDDRTLEQVVQGHRIGMAGKRADALMKTRARINSLCFVEIKRHDTPLLSTRDYRPRAFAPSAEVAGGVVQVQATVQAALESIGRKIDVTDQQGNPTGEHVFNFDPRAYLVVGSLSEFETEHGPNEDKVRSFELFRRNVRRPEIITFDELFQRARFIVQHDQHSDATAEPLTDDPPF
ncbi:DUF4263 domain-containing protein [Sphingomonas sp. SUN019]|uniref:Shedu immune nuclease family protein n=1 Tax=Sphingomonas sp. SUN019 TaxID=2937788 RepID=UPI0021648608|nr:Shedu immune nuclease family protein [Sphingomonas sp. SUN019]UVO49154.1 DUF4263 domain-containing protein [Sphingomonas sp. SUN019]